MLRHDHVDGQIAHHARPQLQHLARHHIAAVERLHFGDVPRQGGHGHRRVGRLDHGHAQVARKQDAADRVPELEVAFGMHEVRGQCHQFGAAHRNAHARVGNAHDAALRFARLAKVRCKPLPQAGDVELGLGAGHPAVERRDDVGVGVRGQDFVQLLRRKVAPHGQQHFVVGHVATRVDDAAVVVVNHQKLVGLHGIAALVGQVAEHQAHMPVVVEQFDGHGSAPVKNHITSNAHIPATRCLGRCPASAPPPAPWPATACCARPAPPTGARPRWAGATPPGFAGG